MSLPRNCSMLSRLSTTTVNIDTQKKENDSETQALKINAGSTAQSTSETKQERLEREFGSLLRKYNCNLNDVIDIVLKITGDKIENLEKYDETKINNAFNAAEKAFNKIYNKDTQSLDTDKAINKAKQYYNYIKSGGSLEDFDNKDKVQTLSGKSEDEILKYFEDKLEEYKKQNESTAQKELKKDFYRILAQTPDSEKKLLLPVLLTVLRDTDTVENFFNTFDDKNLRTQCADSIDNETLSGLNNEENKNILYNVLKNMSVERVDKYLKSVDDKYKELYNSYSDIFQTVLEKIKNNEPLGPDNREVELKEKLDVIFGEYNIILASLPMNENFSQEDVENRTNRVLETQRQYGTEHLYLESLAQFVNENKISLNIGEEKLEQLKNYLDKATDGEYSKAAERVAEKNSAIDSQTGLLKQVTQDEVEEKRKSVQQLTEQYIVEDPEEKVEFKVERPAPEKDSNSPKLGFVLPQASDTAKMFAIVKNKVDNVTNDMIKEAVETYKKSGLADKIKVLALATGRVFEKVLEDNDTSTFRRFLEGGNKCKTFAMTEKVQEAVDEGKKKGDVA